MKLEFCPDVTDLTLLLDRKSVTLLLYYKPMEHYETIGLHTSSWEKDTCDSFRTPIRLLVARLRGHTVVLVLWIVSLSCWKSLRISRGIPCVLSTVVGCDGYNAVSW